MTTGCHGWLGLGIPAKCCLQRRDSESDRHELSLVVEVVEGCYFQSARCDPNGRVLNHLEIGGGRRRWEPDGSSILENIFNQGLVDARIRVSLLKPHLVPASEHMMLSRLCCSAKYVRSVLSEGEVGDQR